MRKKGFISIIVLCLLWAGTAWAETPERKVNVAVLPFVGDEHVSEAQLEFITSSFVGELVGLDAFNVLDRGKMDYILQEQGFQKSGACNSTECRVEMGQLLGMDNIVSGNLVRFGNSYALNVEYTDLQTGRILKTFGERIRGELDEVFEALCRNTAVKLVQYAAPDIEVPDLIAAKAPASDKGASIADAEVTEISTELTAQVEIPDSLDAKAKINYQPEAISKKSLSTGKKIALSLGGIGLASIGSGAYFDARMDKYLIEVDEAIAYQHVQQSYDAFDKAQKHHKRRNITYTAGIGSLVSAVALWLLVE